MISFDNDLADEHYNPCIPEEDYKEKTGYECLKWLIHFAMDNKVPLPKMVLCHSMNTVARERIENLVDNFNTFRKKHLR